MGGGMIVLVEEGEAVELRTQAKAVAVRRRAAAQVGARGAVRVVRQARRLG